jgi:hypothetical protein
MRLQRPPVDLFLHRAETPLWRMSCTGVADHDMEVLPDTDILENRNS